METSQKISPKIFLNKVLAGTATGIIIGLIPNAVLGAILKYFSAYPFAVTIAISNTFDHWWFDCLTIWI